MSNEIIRLSKINKKFYTNDKNINVLKNINLKINKGELIALVESLMSTEEAGEIEEHLHKKQIRKGS